MRLILLLAAALTFAACDSRGEDYIMPDNATAHPPTETEAALTTDDTPEDDLD